MPSLPSWPRRVRDSARQEGALRFAVRAALSPVYRWAWVRTQPLDHPLDEPGEPPSSLELRWATEADIPALITLRRQYRPDALRARFAAGQTCLLSLVDGQVASVRWVNAATMDMEYLGLALPLVDDEICVYEVYARPALRHLQVRRRAWEMVVRHYLQRGKRHTVDYVIPGRKPFGRDRTYVVGSVHVLRLGPWRFHWSRAPGPEAAHWRQRLRTLGWKP